MVASLQSAALERAPRRAPKKRPHNKKKTDAVEEDVQDAQQPQESLLVRIHKAKERNEALTSVLKAQLAQVSFCVLFNCVNMHLSRSYVVHWIRQRQLCCAYLSAKLAWLQLHWNIPASELFYRLNGSLWIRTMLQPQSSKHRRLIAIWAGKLEGRSSSHGQFDIPRQLEVVAG